MRSHFSPRRTRSLPVSVSAHLSGYVPAALVDDSLLHILSGRPCSDIFAKSVHSNLVVSSKNGRVPGRSVLRPPVGRSALWLTGFSRSSVKSSHRRRHPPLKDDGLLERQSEHRGEHDRGEAVRRKRAAVLQRDRRLGRAGAAEASRKAEPVQQGAVGCHPAILSSTHPPGAAGSYRCAACRDDCFAFLHVSVVCAVIARDSDVNL